MKILGKLGLRPLSVKDITFISFFIALQIILTRFAVVYITPTLRIEFNFLALSMCAAIFGPFWGGAAAAIADVLGVTLFSGLGFFPGFTLSRFVDGMIYGYFLYNKEKTYKKVAIPVVLVCLVVMVGLDTFWLTILYGNAFMALLPARLVKVACMIPIQIILIPLLWSTVGSRVAVMASSGGADS